MENDWGCMVQLKGGHLSIKLCAFSLLFAKSHGRAGDVLLRSTMGPGTFSRSTRTPVFAAYNSSSHLYPYAANLQRYCVDYAYSWVIYLAFDYETCECADWIWWWIWRIWDCWCGCCCAEYGSLTWWIGDYWIGGGCMVGVYDSDKKWRVGNAMKENIEEVHRTGIGYPVVHQNRIWNIFPKQNIPENHITYKSALYIKILIHSQDI